MANITTANKDVIASYLFTVAKYDFSIYEKRIIYRLLDLAQEEIKGIMIKDHLYKIHKTECDRKITMPVRWILRDEEDKNYMIAKKAFKSLANKGLEYEDDKIWTYINIIAAPKVDKTGGFVTFTVFDEVWQCLLNFSEGFRKYELFTAMRFKSTYSMRLYELMSGQKLPLTFVGEAFESLCDRFKLPKSMRGTQAFEKYVLDIAKVELDAYSPYSFIYQRETVPSRGRNGLKVVGYTFIPVELPQNRDSELEKTRLEAKLGSITGPNGMLKPHVVTVLEHFGFTKEEINRNKKLFINAQLTFTPDGLIDKLGHIRTSAFKRGRQVREITNIKGYIIGALKIALQESAPKQLMLDAEPRGAKAHNKNNGDIPPFDTENLARNLADKFSAK